MKIDALISGKLGSAGDEGISAAANSTHPKVVVQWLNESLCFYQSLCLVGSESLRNRHLRVTEKRCTETIREDKKDGSNRNSQQLYNPELCDRHIPFHVEPAILGKLLSLLEDK